ncbi:MAG: acyl-CoA dehydrogenase family protein [Gammaproteobacteria bacterium]|nr:acyl-CoA dehydrogenase family protein [Gammaproteobacteria bacterium]
MSDRHKTTPLERAKSVYPDIVCNGDAIEQERELPSDLANRLKELGMFRLLVPKSLGGEEMDFPEYLEVVRLISHADGSTGWCLNQGAVFATHAGRAQRRLAEEVWGDPSGVVGNGPPSGASYTMTDSGYLLTGRWSFSSGCRHANWLAAAAGGTNHEPALLHFVPKPELDLLDVWQVNGLRGTGSFSFEAKDHFVPNDRSMRLDTPPVEDGPLYVVPQGLLFACGFGCVALGVARSAIDCVIELSKSKRAQFARDTLSEDPVVQSKIGQAQAIVEGARALLDETVHDVWKNVGQARQISVDDRIRLRLVGTHAIRQSANAVDIVYNLSGSTSIFANQAIQRKFQDAHVITQQVQGRESHYQTVGAHLLGIKPKGGIY